MRMILVRVEKVEQIFKKNMNGKKLSKKKVEIFHYVALALTNL